MLNLTANIKIGGRVFTSVASVKITTSIEDFMDTATLVLPQVERGEVKEGDEVSVELGYEGVCRNYEFFGKVNDISPASPYEIRCLDPFNDLRRQKMLRIFYKEPIRKILTQLLKDSGYSLGEVSAIAGARRVNLNSTTWTMKGTHPMSKRKAIRNLALDNGFFCYFKDRRLFFLDRNVDAILPGDAYPLYQQGINIIENSLLYNEGNTIKKVTVYSDSPGGIPLSSTYISPKVKDSSIEKSFDVSGLNSDGDCYVRAKEISDRLNSPGYTGDLKTFGHPFVRSGQFCGIQMKGQEYPVIQAVKKTEVTFDNGGYRRTVTPSSTPADVFNINKIFRQLKTFDYFGRSAG